MLGSSVRYQRKFWEITTFLHMSTDSIVPRVTKYDGKEYDRTKGKAIPIVMQIAKLCVVNDEFFRVLIARPLIGFYAVSSVFIMPLTACADKPLAIRHRNRCETETCIKHCSVDLLCIYELQVVTIELACTYVDYAR